MNGLNIGFHFYKLNYFVSKKHAHLKTFFHNIEKMGKHTLKILTHFLAIFKHYERKDQEGNLPQKI